MIKRMSSKEARGLLAEGRVGRLGCLADEWPYVVPVSYIFDNDSIYVHSLPGRKIRALASDPRACLQVDDIKNEFQWCSVLAFGHYEEITSNEEREQVLLKLLARFPHLTPAESMSAGQTVQPEVIVFRIRVREITGLSEE